MSIERKKAEELVEQYNEFDFNTVSNSENLEKAKKCALIACDEILELPLETQLKRHKLNGDTPNIDTIDFWIHVKEEINKL